MTLATFNGIKALIMEEDVILLKRYAAQTTVNGLCLEIGSYEGASAWSILQGLPERYDLVCCSRFWKDEYAKFRNFMLNQSLWPRVIPVTCDYHILWDHIEPAPIAFAFIDHDHTNEGMRDVLAMLLPHCVKGSILMFHDYGHEGYPAVKQHVDALDKGKFEVLYAAPLMAVVRGL